MKTNHQEMLRALHAAQVAFYEYIDENLSENVAKAALLKSLAQATKLAKQLED